MFELLDFKDAEKARRSLLICSIATLIAGGFQSSLKKLSVFGIVFTANSDRIINFGRVATFVTLLVFLLRSAPTYVEAFRNLGLKRVDREASLKWNEFNERIGRYPDESAYYDSSLEGEEQEIRDEIESLKYSVNRKYSKYSYNSLSAAILFVEIILPMFCGLMAIFVPGVFVNFILDHLPAP